MGKNFIFAILIVAVVSLVTATTLLTGNNPTAEQNQLKKFSSYDELKDFLKNNRENYSRGFGGFERIATTTGFAKTSLATAAESLTPASAADYSATNIQVEGVDEADIVKNDGKYIYTIVGNKLVIVDAYPAEEAKVVSEIKLQGTPAELFVNKNKLAVLGHGYSYGNDAEVTEAGGVGIASPTLVERPIRYSGASTLIEVYDISDREKPVLARTITVRGDYRDSRMIGNYVYAIANQPVYYYGEGPVPLPAIAEDGKEKLIAAQDIYYFDYPDYSYNYNNILAFNIQNDNEEYNSKTFLGGSAQNLYVSEGNIYLTNTVYMQDASVVKTATEAVKVAAGLAVAPQIEREEKTAIRKISISNGAIEYKGQGSVPGHVLNQFSMDEHNGYFRIATTTGEVARFSGSTTAKNHIYVLDENLKIAGSLEDLAPGEKIYSARFMGNRAYLVTFKKVDPLFVIDLSNPEQPEVLGKLKIPGYSDYLHPYDENHIIGLGKEAVEAEEGDFAWYQGIKLALFDVTDPENPKEISKYGIGDRGTDSYALQDHKAFLFSRQKNLLVIPIQLAEIDESRYSGGEVPPNAYGEFVWQGAYVFELDTESGFKLKGRVTHLDSEEGKQQLLKSGYYFNSDYSIKRSLYMDDVLYTLSDKAIKMNDIDDLDEVNMVKLPFSGSRSY